MAMTERPIDTRFWSRVSRGEPDECWEWRGCVDEGGYGRFIVRRPGKRYGRRIRAHRMAFVLSGFRLPAAEGKWCVCHHCDNRRCCNPGHLYLGTQGDNNEDMRRKGRARGVPGNLHRATHSLDQVSQVKRLLAAGLVRREVCHVLGVDVSFVGRIARGDAFVAVTAAEEG